MRSLLAALLCLATAGPLVAQTCPTPRVQLTATRGGMYTVWRDGDSVSAHSTERGAAARTLEGWLTEPGRQWRYTLMYEVRASGCQPTGPAIDPLAVQSQWLDPSQGTPDRVEVVDRDTTEVCVLFRFADGAVGTARADRVGWCATRLEALRAPRLSGAQQAIADTSCLAFTGEAADDSWRVIPSRAGRTCRAFLVAR